MSLTTRLSNLVEHLNLLLNKQIKDRKNKFAINASLCLIHDIQTTKEFKNVFSCFFLNVKDAFNHVLTDRLIAISHKSKISNQLIR